MTEFLVFVLICYLLANVEIVSKDIFTSKSIVTTQSVDGRYYLLLYRHSSVVVFATN